MRLLLDNIPAMVSYWDRELRNVVVNRAFIDFFGTTAAEVRGRHFREVLGDNLYELSRAHVDGVLAGGKQVFGSTLTDWHGRSRHGEATCIPDIVEGEVSGFYVYVQVADAEARVEAEQARDDAVRLLQISMDNAPVGQAIVDMSIRARYVNPALCAMFGYSADELIGVDLRNFVHPADVATAAADFDKLKNGSQSPVTSELRLVHRDGTTIWVQRNAVMVPGVHGSDDLVIGQFVDISARKRAEAELARRAVTDALTGLGNREAFFDCIQNRRVAEPAGSVGIVFIDLDGFKRINDAHGHGVGDAVLIQVARRITQIAVAPDSVYRLGGDEFVVLSTNAETEQHVAELAKRLRRALTGGYDTPATQLTLSASVGCTWGPTEDIEQLLRDADAHMYRQKARRRRNSRLSDAVPFDAMTPSPRRPGKPEWGRARE
ncbi:diguanylate cyclase [Mycobacterium sp. 663a-19]|uniref:diguanylate cyclase domain-containing protein n=1 Tax=Mycobacterium sp. 663a-19 TaxID=2986148 RepID=UPI002D1EF335|nr:diguanylate cyclase [Mycobacterium sp. 663a-19]MEB3982165.1 diguanylate cyclase [Mycobacterium sp. 663a-19]